MPDKKIAVKPKFIEVLEGYLALEVDALNENQKEFIRGRESYITDPEVRKKFKSVLKGKSVVAEKAENPIDEFPPVTESRRIARGAKRKADKAKADAEVKREALIKSDKKITATKVKEAEKSVEELQEGVKKAQEKAKSLGDAQAKKRVNEKK